MRLRRIIGAIMLISCTAIGGGILALPIKTYYSGIIPTTINFIISWGFMTLSALYLFEVSINSKAGDNIISMAYETLGTPGKDFAWLSYLSLLYALMCAFISSLSSWIMNYFGFSFLASNIVISILFCIILFSGTDYIDSVNKFFSTMLFLSICYLIYFAAQKVSASAFVHNNFKNSLTNTPLIITSFGFAIVIPSLNNYLNFQAKTIYKTILIGSTIPLILYILWEYSILGSLGELLISQGLQNANGSEVARALSKRLNNRMITMIAQVFSITAITTSVLGVQLSLFDFLADGLQITKNYYGRILLCILIFVPTIILNLFLPFGFDIILSFSGIFVALLLGIMPSIMVYRKRILKKNIKRFAPGNNFLILINILFFISVIIIECKHLV